MSEFDQFSSPIWWFATVASSVLATLISHAVIANTPALALSMRGIDRALKAHLVALSIAGFYVGLLTDDAVHTLPQYSALNAKLQYCFGVGVCIPLVLWLYLFTDVLFRQSYLGKSKADKIAWALLFCGASGLTLPAFFAPKLGWADLPMLFVMFMSWAILAAALGTVITLPIRWLRRRVAPEKRRIRKQGTNV